MGGTLSKKDYYTEVNRLMAEKNRQHCAPNYIIEVHRSEGMTVNQAAEECIKWAENEDILADFGRDA
jgi:hypothetical protein